MRSDLCVVRVMMFDAVVRFVRRPRNIFELVAERNVCLLRPTTHSIQEREMLLLLNNRSSMHADTSASNQAIVHNHQHSILCLSASFDCVHTRSTFCGRGTSGSRAPFLHCYFALCYTLLMLCCVQFFFWYWVSSTVHHQTHIHFNRFIRAARRNQHFKHLAAALIALHSGCTFSPVRCMQNEHCTTYYTVLIAG